MKFIPHPDKTLTSTNKTLPAMIIFMLMAPVNMPAWLVLEFLYAALFGGGFRPVKNPYLASVIIRTVSWLSCSATALAYLIAAQHYVLAFAGFSLLELFLVALITGFAALQAPLLWLNGCGHLGESVPVRLVAAENVSYSLTFIMPGEDFHIYTLTRYVDAIPSGSVSFICACETQPLFFKVVEYNCHSMRVEGTFSTRYFRKPALTSQTGNFARGLLEVRFSEMVNEFEIIDWLPLAPEKMSTDAGGAAAST